MTKFKLQGVGLDTTTIKFNPSLSRVEDNYRYILTSIEANNDFIISNFIKNLFENPLLFTKTEFLDNLTYAIESHLSTIGRNYIDVLFIGNNANLDNLPILKNLITKDKLVNHIGLDNPENLEDLIKSIDIFKKNNLEIEYILLDICPLDFNLEIINYCNENNITIVGVNQFGGYLSAPRNIKVFSVPYLLSFSANYSDIILVSGRDLIQSVENKDYLNKLIGKESSPEFVLKKSIKKQVKELKKVIYTSVIVDGEDIIVPYNDPELMLMPEDFKPNIGSYITKVKNTNVQITEDSDISNKVNDYLKIIYYPVDGTREDKFAVARYKVINYLNALYKDCRLEILKVGSSLLLVSLIKDPKVKGYLFWKKIVPGEIKQFYMVLPLDESKGLLFKEVISKSKKATDLD